MDEKVIYICSATPNQIINLMPLLQLDLDNVHYIIMLVGKHQTPTERDREAALQYLKDFHRTLRIVAEQRNKTKPKCREIVNPPDDTSGWQKTVADTLNGLEERQSPLAVTLNVTGGTRSMMFGAMLGIQDVRNSRNPQLSWRAVIHLADPARTEQLFPSVVQEPTYLGSVETLDFSEHLSLRSYQEKDRKAQESRQTNTIKRADFTRAMVKNLLLVGEGKVNMRVKILHLVAAQAEEAAQNQRKADKDSRPFPCDMASDVYNVARNNFQHDSGTFWKNMFCQYQNKKGAKCLYSIDSSGSIEFTGKAATGYFSGSWFEEYIFLLCRDTLSQRQDVQMHLGVSYTDMSDDNNAGPAGEIDIVVQVKNDLHLIECKAGRVAGKRNPDGVDRSGIRTIIARRRQIAGPTGSARLISFQTGDRKFSNSLKSEARHGDVTIYFGKRGLKEFKEWLRRL